MGKIQNSTIYNLEIYIDTTHESSRQYGETLQSSCRPHQYSVSTTPALHRNFVPHSFFSTYCRKIDKKIDDEISTSISLKSKKYIVSYSLLNLLMAPE